MSDISPQQALTRNPEGYVGPNPACMRPGCDQEARYQFGVHPNWQKASLTAIQREAAMLGLPAALPKRVWFCPEHASHVYRQAHRA